jgi:signal transduction histidine kinase
MNHELRQPITGITNAVIRISRANDKQKQLLQSLVRDEAGNAIITAEQLETMQSQVEKIANMYAASDSNIDVLIELVNQLLFNSRLQANRVEVVFREVNIREWFAKIQLRVEAQMHNKDLQFSINIDPSMPETIVNDPENILEKVVNNFLSNAIKFTPQGGSISVNVYAYGTQFWIEVTDTGVGISQDKLQTVWQEYRQEDERTVREYGGTGIGLSLIARLMEKYGGGYDVRSVKGAGSTFSVFMPLHLTLESTAKERA